MKLYSFPNLGNTCYCNSVLQCLINDPCFKDSLNDSELAGYIKKINISFTKNDQLINHKYNIKEIIDYINPNFKRFQQHDSHEFLLYLIETLNLKQFTGTFKMNIKCQKCQKVKSRFEDYTTIHLNNDLHTPNVVDSFMEYLKQEDIHEYHCETCKEYTHAVQKTYLNILPQRLVLILKRYNCKESTIEYPFENMKIRETKSGKIFVYNLYSVIYHHGDQNFGHYNCDVKIDKEWFFIDDETIYLNNSIKNNSSCYILFYKCC